MKKSEELRKEAEGIDNDLKYLGMATKIMREERNERFEEEWLPKLMKQEVAVTYYGDKFQYEIESYRKFGTIDFYPKANKVLIRNKNKWIKPGLQWLIKNFELK